MPSIDSKNVSKKSSPKKAAAKKAAPKPFAKKTAPTRPSTIDLVAAILEGYANRAVFRGFSRGPVASGKANFKILWHRNRLFDIVLDPKAKTLKMPLVLPEVEPAMYRDFKQWIKSRHSKDLLEHRRIDTRIATLTTAKKGGNVSLTITARKDCEYATRKLVHAVHEVFLSFLTDGPYFDYMVEKFDLDPDKP